MKNNIINNEETLYFSKLYQNYMDDMHNRLKETTIFSKQNIFEKHILPYFGEKAISEISAKDVRQWQNILISTQNYSQTYIKNINNQLSTIFNYACRFYGLYDNPCKIAGSIGRCKAEEMQYWTLEEYMLFRKNLSNDSEAFICFEILYWTGMREGELLALTPDDINPGIIRINKTYKRIHKKDIIGTPKTSCSKRDVPIPHFLEEEIYEYLSKFPDISRSERIFCHTNSFLHHKLKDTCIKSGVKRIRIHDIRHSHASLLINQGFEPIVISKRLGHSNISTTLNIYSHLFPHQQEAILRSLEKIYSSSVII